ncbi:triphosphoribosyl-dephospho-CoA synthase MdcB [Trinickia dabaoshanensis]|uniref:Probable 2-(5''-triphosphoribosyl)-3'-dephosphocoenzyme-A synthase n=1 Tax=Trinickia dabaoshanensis TaxID=564714 RepID=A0A2N7VY98_9BURK|nr:triphosphoribosyl-dephospho-CoA synthase [Trinickia dabaoshanensis]PMS22139.1 triphosphoribosyl-dephospho-CoA synthase MdcB [Trinickia dabaoshanensis]
MRSRAVCDPKREEASLTARHTGLAARLGRLATDALIEEAHATPKPALVDRRGNGAHRDLSLALMERSARALEPTFAALSRAARGMRPSAALRADLGAIGRAGEAVMMSATQGSNAHRGAIWIVGLLVAGATIHAEAGEPHRPAAEAICTIGAQIACFPDHGAPFADSNGSRVRARYGVGGARREAQEGFPHALHLGLPALRAARRRGVAESAARIDALLTIMTTLDDTCLLHRAGPPALAAAKHGAQEVLSAGGTSTPEGQAAFARLESRLLALNASPGGAADLLAATLFIDRLAPASANEGTYRWNI